MCGVWLDLAGTLVACKLDSTCALARSSRSETLEICGGVCLLLRSVRIYVCVHGVDWCVSNLELT